MTKISNNVHSCRQPMAAQRLEETSVSTGEKVLKILGFAFSLVKQFIPNDDPELYSENDYLWYGDYPEYDYSRNDYLEYAYPEYDLRDLEEELDDEDFIESVVYPAVQRKRNRRNRSLTKFNTPSRKQLRKAS